MRRLCTTFALALLLFGMTAYSQREDASVPQSYCYYQGQQRHLELDAGSIAVRVPAGVGEAVLLTSLAPEDVQAVDPVAISGWFFLRLSSPLADVAAASAKITRLLEFPVLEFASPVFHGYGDTWVVIGPDILMRFRSEYAAHAASILAEEAKDLAIVTPDFGNMPGTFKLRSSARNGFEVLAAANRLATDKRVEWSEPDAMISGHGGYVPNDPGWVFLWGINNTGQTGGTANMDMDGDLAWDVTTGSTSVKILVIDVGVQQDHPDIHQLAGADMTGDGGGGGPMNACDKHGTAVAGCISARIDNDTGTVGIAPNCYVLSARTFRSNLSCDGSWSSFNSWTVDALTWGEAQGARVSNNSNAYAAPSDVINAKYQSTYANGMIHFASSGNDTATSISYPSSAPYVNSVGALDDDGVQAIFSNDGAGLDFSAPGVSIYTTDRTGAAGYENGDYTFKNGTSFASPYAAGVAALVLSRFPGYTPAQVEAKMQRACKDLGSPGYDQTYGWGFVNAYRSLYTFAAFSVNMKVKMRDGTFRPDLGDRVTVQGTFNSWANTDTMNDDDLDSIYVRTIGLPPFTGHMYKFWKTVRGPLGLEAGNRYLDLTDVDTTLPTPYFNNENPVLPPAFSVIPSGLEFGVVQVGNTKTDSVTVSNPGTGTLTVDSVRSDDVAFTVMPTSGSVPPAGSQKFYVTFQPAGAGADGGTIVFYHNAPSTPDTVDVSGTGTVAVSAFFLTIPPETLSITYPAKPNVFIKAVKRKKGLYPNWANLRDELVAQGGFAPGRSDSDSAGGLRIGVSYMERRNFGDPARPNWKPIKDSAKVHCWVRIGKYNFKKSVGASPNSIPKTLRSRGSIFHTGVPRGLDSTGVPGALKRKLLTKEIKILDPKKTSNRLFAELVGLKVSIATSALGKTPAGLGELIFDRDGNFLDELTVKQISAKADSMLTLWRGHTSDEYDSLYSAIRDINRAFAGRLDTITWEQPVSGFPAGNLTVKGQIDVSTVPFLRLPSPFVPLQVAPTAYVTEPDIEFGEDDFDDEEASSPVAAKLYQNYPNPFNPTTTIAFRLREYSRVTMRVFDLLGREVALLLDGEEMEDGYQTLEFSAEGLASGLYFYRIEARGLDDPGLHTVAVNKMLLLK